MSDFIEEVFPVAVSVGSTGGPRFSTDVNETEGGFEYRNVNWSQARHAYNVSTGIGDAAAWAETKDWFMRCAGRAFAFRFVDPGDNTSHADGWSDPSPTDQQIGIGDGTRTRFGLVKSYDGYLRDILKPVEGTVTVSIDGALVNPDQYDVDHTTGIITFGGAPAAGKVIRAGFVFDVPCRFESDELTASWTDANLVQGNIGIIEIRQRRTV